MTSLNAEDIGFLLAPTYRSRAIVQMFEQEKIKVDGAVVLPGVAPKWDGDAVISLPSGFNFRPNGDLQDDLKRQNIPYVTAPNVDVNSSEFVEFIKNQKQKVYIYSGVAGCILRKNILNSGKRFIHAHGGDAPRYSGSTAFYYSILECELIGATVFWMDEGLDTGDIIEKLVIPPLPGVEIDRIQDPVIRARAFVLAVKKLLNGDVGGHKQNNAERRTYHVIHPVLKYYALKKCGLGKD